MSAPPSEQHGIDEAQRAPPQQAAVCVRDKGRTLGAIERGRYPLMCLSEVPESGHIRDNRFTLG